MASPSPSLQPGRRARGTWRKTIARPSFWIVFLLLAVITLIHYVTPQERLLPRPLAVFFERHAVERIIFVLPVAVAAAAFRQKGGLLTLALAILLMLPRVIWISPYPTDAIAETAAAAVVGGLVVWMIETQAREKALHQQAAARLGAIQAVTAIVNRSLELDQILIAALDKVLEVMNVETGLIFSLARGSQELVLAASRGLAPESTTELDRPRLGEGFWGQVAQAGELAVVAHISQDPWLAGSMIAREGLQGIIVVPLKSKDQVHGILAVATRQRPEREGSPLFSPQEQALLVTIGNEIGVAIDNARLYDRMRFYVRAISRAQEDERQRIARELHDETIQMLVVLARRIEALCSPTELVSEATHQRLRALQELLRDITGGMRRFVRDLRPPTLDDLGLVAAVRGVTGDLAKKDGIATELQVTGEEKRLMREEELALFRIAQEALNNVRRHARASKVMVQFEFFPHEVHLMVEDDGCGFDASERTDDLLATGRLGLMGMHERARALGGGVMIQSEPGQGTRVLATVPVHPQSEGTAASD